MASLNYYTPFGTTKATEREMARAVCSYALYARIIRRNVEKALPSGVDRLAVLAAEPG